MRWSDLPAHAELIEGLIREVEGAEHWRWLELCCSLASERGDELSDIDACVGHALAAEHVGEHGMALVGAIGAPLDVLAHAEDAWPEGILRFAVEYDNGVQLDLVAMPAGRRPGLPEGSIALSDKDGLLSTTWTPPVASATGTQAREWTMLGWWAVSNVAKYVRRDARFEAVEALRDARTQALRLFAVGHRIPYPAFGLTSLLDVEPYPLPDDLAATYATADEPGRLLAAVHVVVDVLTAASRSAGEVLDLDLSTPWADIARARLAAAAATVEPTS